MPTSDWQTATITYEKQDSRRIRMGRNEFLMHDMEEYRENYPWKWSWLF